MQNIRRFGSGSILHFAFCVWNYSADRQRPTANGFRSQRQSGYLLLVLLISVALLSIAAAAAAPSIAQQIKREREDELIHRGKQYAEAVKRFYTKFHRYPANLDQLMDTNGIRFLRKRYADPFTGKDDWKLVHQGEATIPNFQFGAGPGIPGGVAPTAMGATPTGMAGVNPAITGAGITTGVAGATGAASAGGTPSAPGTSSGTTTATGNIAGQTLQVRPGVGGIVIAELVSNVSTTAGQESIEGTSQSSSQAGDTGASSGSNTASNSSYIGAQSPNTQSGTAGSTFGGTQSSFGGTQSTFGGTRSAFGGTQSGSTFGAAGGANPFGTNSAFAAGQQLGGGAIIGVASTSTQQSIREFNNKDHYNEWAFIYDPRLDTRPVGGTGGGTIGQPIAPGQNGGSPFGQRGAGAGTTSPTPTPPTTNPPQPPL